MKSRLVVAMLVVLMSAVSAHAQNTAWQQLPGPYGGLTYTLLQTTGTSGNTMFAGTDNGIYRSDDGGATWQRSGLSQLRIRQLLQFKSSLGPAVTLFASGPSGVYRSADVGLSWTLVLSDTNHSFDQLLQHGQNVVAISSDDRHFAPQSDSLYISNDIGTTWRSQPLPATLRDLTGLASSPNFLIASSFADGVFRTNDFITWTQSNYPIGYTTERLKKYGNNYFASGTGGIRLSTDNGANWIMPANGNLDTLDEIVDFVVDGLTMYGLSRESIVYKSTDAARAWTRNSQLSLLDEPYYLELIGNRFYETARSGIYISSDAAHWSHRDSLLNAAEVHDLTVAGDRVFALTFGAVVSSSDRGLTWNQPSLSDPFVSNRVTGLFTYHNEAFAYGSELYRWTGAQWEDVSTLPGSSVLVDNDQLLSWTADSNIYRSSDGGRSWEHSGDGIPYDALKSHFLLRAGSNLVDVVSYDRGVGAHEGHTLFYVSTDNGARWQLSDTLAELLGPIDHASIPGGAVFTTGSARLFASFDNGLTWQAHAAPFPDISLSMLRPFAGGVVASAFTGNDVHRGLYFTRDLQTWTSLTDTIALPILSFASIGGEAFVGTWGASVWKADLSYLEVKRHAETATSLRIGVYPNPAIDRVHVHVLNYETIRSIDVLSTTGSVVRTEAYDGVSNEREMSLSGLASGSYILRVRTNAGEQFGRVQVSR